MKTNVTTRSPIPQYRTRRPIYGHIEVSFLFQAPPQAHSFLSFGDKGRRTSIEPH